MKRIVVLLSALLVVAALASCAKRADEGSASTSAAAPAASSLPAGLDQGPRAADEPANGALAETGEGLFKSKGCSACHTFGQKLTGPDLAGVSHRRTAKWIESQILHPDKMTKEDPISHELFAKFALQMPNQGLTPDEAKAVIEYFKHQDAEASK
jgi:mono/diheme cytochrome c family protein